MSEKRTAQQVLLAAHDTRLTPSYRIEIIKQYARDKCKEQRELCAGKIEETVSYSDLLNAPEPDFNETVN